MNSRKFILFTIAVIATALQVQPVIAADQPGPVKISGMFRFESHSSVYNALSGDFSGETFGYTMLAASREIGKNVVGSLFYLNRYSFDDSDFVSHIGGVTLMKIFSPNITGTFGYTYTSDPSRGTLFTFLDKNDRDRFMSSLIYTFNPSEKTGPRYSAITSFSSTTDLGEQQSLSEKLGVKFPVVSKRLEADLSYNFTYSLKENDQLTNQFSGVLTYKHSDSTKLSIGVLFIDNVYEFNQGDDTVVQFSINHSLR